MGPKATCPSQAVRAQGTGGWSPLHSSAARAGSESGEGEGHSPQRQGGSRACGEGGRCQRS